MDEEGKVLIADLPEAESVADSSFIPVDNGNLTQKITVENFNASSNETAKAYAEAAANSATTAQEAIADVNNKVDLAQGYASSASESARNSQTYATNSQTYAGNSQGYANTAQGHATNAAASASAATGSADAANEAATLAKSFCQGGTGARPGENTNNAKYWASVAETAAQQTIDDHLDPNSTNPVQNRAIYDAINEMHTGGSIITVTTGEQTLRGKEATITDGTTTYTATINQTGKAVFEGVLLKGSLTISASDGTRTASTIIPVPYFGIYSTSLAFWSATITVGTDTDEFDGLEVRAVKNGVTVARATFANDEAVITVPETGSYVVETTLDIDYAKTFRSSAISVSEQTDYPVTLNGFIATVEIETSDADFLNLPIAVSLDGDPLDTDLAFVSGAASFKALETGTFTFSVTYGGDVYPVSVTVSAETTYSGNEINRWTATVNITGSSQFQLQPITVLKNGIDTGIQVSFKADGTQTIILHEQGSYVFTCDYDSYTYKSAAVSVNAEDVYSTSITAFIATLNISTTSIELFSQPIAITNGTESITTSFSSGTGGTATAQVSVHETGTYTCTCTYQSDEFIGTAEVVAGTYTYNVVINSFLTITATIYGATEDTISYTDINGSHLIEFDSGESSKSGVVIVVSPDSPNVTFTSAVAKNPADITLDYTKTVTITDGMTSIYVMPTQPVYWYGYEPNAFQAYAYKPSDSGSSTVTPSISRSTNSLTMTLRGSNTYNYGTIAQSVPVELQDMNTLCIIGSGTEMSMDVRNAYLISAVSNNFSYSVETKFPTSTGFVASAIPSEAYTYPAIAANAPANTTKTIVMNAFWLDDTIQIYSAAEDDVYIINNGVTIPLCHTDSTGLGFVSKDKLPVGTYTIYSSVAKNPSSLSDAYSKSVTVTSGTTEIYLMPEGSILYWYGYIVPSFTTAAYGWSGSSGTRNKPTESRSTNYVSLTQQEARIGVWYTDSYSIGTNNTSNAIVELGTAQYGMSVLVIDSATFANNYTTNNGIRDHAQVQSQTLFLSSTNANISDSTRGVGIETFGSTIKVYALWLSEEVTP